MRDMTRVLVIAAVTFVAVFSVVTIRKMQDRDAEGEHRFSLRIVRTTGDAAARSRCSECTQPGDRIEVLPQSSRYGRTRLLVYRDGRLMIDGGVVPSLSFVVSTMGTFEIVGLDLARVDPCQPGDPMRGVDSYVASMIYCGERFAVVSFEAR